MNSKKELEKKMPQLQAIPREKVTNPDGPPNVVISEAEDLVVNSQKDREQLTGGGLNEMYIDDLPSRTAAFRHAESNWKESQADITEAKNEWKIKSVQAHDLRAEMVHAFLFAYRKHEKLLRITRKINEGDSQADMIQDLNDLAVLGQKHTEPLKAVNFDLSLLKTADQLSDEMGSLRARANGETDDIHENKDIRDRAFVFLKEAIDEIRKYGKYVFWKEPEKLKHYRSEYYHKMRGRSKKKQDQEEDDTSNTPEQNPNKIGGKGENASGADNNKTNLPNTDKTNTEGDNKK